MTFDFGNLLFTLYITCENGGIKEKELGSYTLTNS
jgi:hypothetical protein